MHRGCTLCRQLLGAECFGFKNKSTSLRQSRCLSCNRLLARGYYQRDPASYKRRAAASKSRTKEAVREALRAFLRSHPCTDCGEVDITVLEFDHRGSKRNNVSDLVRRSASWTLILAEIAKCDVVCANCHRRRTARAFRWHKLFGLGVLVLLPLPRRGTPDYERIKNYRNATRRRFRNRSLLLAHLREHPCVMCGAEDPVVLDFDHLRDKVRDVGRMVVDGGLDNLLDEIGKCRVLCANCHRRATAARAGRSR